MCSEDALYSIQAVQRSCSVRNLNNVYIPRSLYIDTVALLSPMTVKVLSNCLELVTAKLFLDDR